MDPIEFAATFDAEGDTLSGVVHVFGTRTLRDGRYHTFDPHAFDRDLANGRAVAFYAHDVTKPLARPALSVVDGALHYSMTLGQQSYAQDLRENVRAGLMDKMSFGVQPERFTDTKEADGTVTRRHTVSGLFDISPVVIPAFTGTESQLHAEDPDQRRREAARARYRANGGMHP